MEENNSNGLLIAFSGLGNYGAGNVQQTGMGQLAASQTLFDSNITTLAFSHNQIPEAFQAATEYHAINPDAPISIAGHSMGADSAIQLTNQLGESDIPVSNLFTVSTPPGFMTTDLTSTDVGQVHNFYTSGQDYYVTNDTLVDHANNYEVGETHTSIDESLMVQQFIEQTVIQEGKESEAAKEIERELPDTQSDFSAYEHAKTSQESQSDKIEATAEPVHAGSDHHANTGGM